MEGLQSLGWAIHQWSELKRNHGQPMMNNAAGEAAPCWEIRAWMRDDREITIQGHQPALWILKFSPTVWGVDDASYTHFQTMRLHLDAPQLPPSWCSNPKKRKE